MCMATSVSAKSAHLLPVRSSKRHLPEALTSAETTEHQLTSKRVRVDFWEIHGMGEMMVSISQWKQRK